MGPRELKTPTFPDFKVHTTSNNFLNQAQTSEENIRMWGRWALLDRSFILLLGTSYLQF